MKRDSRGRFVGGGGGGRSRMRINDRSADVIKRVRQTAKQRIQDFAEVMVEKAKELSPVAKIHGGNNRDSIHWEWVGPFSARVLTESGYGAYLEFGTSKMAARPYMAPAFEFAKEEIGGKPWA